MEDRKQELLRKLSYFGIQKDPQWVDRLDEPVTLRDVLELMMELLEQRDPPDQPFD